MHARRGVGGFGAVTRLRAIVAVCLALSLLAAGAAIEARAREALRALDYHATVVNGEIVGSAFAIGADLAVTNAHVVRGLRPGSAVALTPPDGTGSRVTAWLVAVSPRMDLALLRIPAGLLPSVAAEDAPATPGLRVVAAGVDAGAGLGPRMALAGSVLVPRAELAAFGPGLIARVPGMRPGFSGGPMLDERGRLVGMVTAIRPGSGHRTSAASGFAPGRPPAAEEAYVLRASAIRAEARRLLAAAGG